LLLLSSQLLRQATHFAEFLSNLFGRYHRSSGAALLWSATLLTLLK
jgi:hypothetical protein